MRNLKRIKKNFLFDLEKIYKGKAILYGNCHMIILEEYLNRSKTFRNKWQIQSIPLFYEGGGGISKELLSKCDLFIYQEIRETNQYGVEYSSDYLLKQLPDGCIRLCVPNLYELGYGFFPQNLMQTQQPKYYNKFNPSFQGDERGLFVHGDKVIQDLLRNNTAVNHIIQKIINEDVIDEKFIIENFNNYWEKIRERERKWDIKVYNFLRNTYQKQQIFIDFGHPTNLVIKYITENILLYLKLKNDIEDIKIELVLDEYEDPIYPCVTKTLGLKYQKEFLRENSNKKLRDEMDLEEYIREYCYWCQVKGE